jgi:hypothetical protein
MLLELKWKYFKKKYLVRLNSITDSLNSQLLYSQNVNSINKPQKTAIRSKITVLQSISFKSNKKNRQLETRAREVATKVRK